MKDYQKQLKMFSFKESKEKTKIYFDKYWLSLDEYSDKWHPIQTRIFHSKVDVLSGKIFKKDYKLIPLIGGIIFAQNDYNLLIESLRLVNDKFFIIIEDYDKNNPVRVYCQNNEYIEHPPLRFKYPIDTEWGELLNGGYISLELFQSSYKNYFVFSESGKWGKYVANDYDYPLDIIGVKDEYTSIFYKKFKTLFKEDQNKIKKNIPLIYNKFRNLIDLNNE